jgi:hypothetical protein
MIFELYVAELSVRNTIVLVKLPSHQTSHRLGSSDRWIGRAIRRTDDAQSQTRSDRCGTTDKLQSHQANWKRRATDDMHAPQTLTDNATGHLARAKDLATMNRQPEGWGGPYGSPSIVSLIVTEAFELKVPV